MIPNIRLFSYGTLQLESVQRTLFGRTLEGQRDVLTGYRRALLPITDANEAAALGQTHHAIAVFTGNDADEIEGTVLLLTETELLHADAYEPPEYTRVSVTLRSGVVAWVYADTLGGGRFSSP